MKQEHKLIAAVAILMVLIGVVYMVRKDEKAERDAHSAQGAASDLPEVKISADAKKAITKIEIQNKEKGNVVLEKKDDKWLVTKPIEAAANQKNVESLLDNMEKIELKAQITAGTDSYEKYELSGDKTVHVMAFAGAETKLDMYFGKSGSRGQMSRVEGTDGVYAAKGYSGYLYTRELKNWRDTEIFKFEDKNVVSVDIENKHAKFSFSKNGDDWSKSFAKRDEDGKLGKPNTTWELFDPKKVENMLRAFKTLKATDFGDDKSETGFADALTEGGTVRISLKDDGGDHTLIVGKAQEGSNRFAKKDGSDQVYVVSSWAADWATAEPKKFETEKKDDDDKKDAKKGDKKDAMSPDIEAALKNLKKGK